MADTRSVPSRVVIVGGGISGLAAAYRLTQRAGDQRVAVTLVEAEPRLGGKIFTERVDGLVIEAGPDSFLGAKPAAAQLCEALGIGERLIGTRETGGGTYILRGGRLEPLPEGVSGLVPTKLRPLLRSGLLSMRGKLRMALEPFVPARRKGGDESVASFVRRRLGNEAYERMAQPLLSGIYAGDAERMSLLATFPRLRESELRYGSLVRGMLAQRRRTLAPGTSPNAVGARTGETKVRSAFLSLQDGLGELIEALEGALDGVDLRPGVRAVGIERREAGYLVRLEDGARLEADALLLATPAWAAAELLAELAPDLATILREIRYVSTATISLAYRRADVEALGAGGGRGFVIPSIEHRELTAVTWASNKFAGRAPDELALVRGFVGRAGREEAVDLPDDELIRIVRDELRQIVGLTATPVMSRIYHWRRALPQYELGHLERVAAIDRALEALPRLRLLGAAYRGVGIPDCIQSGYAAADAVGPHAPREAHETQQMGVRER